MDAVTAAFLSDIHGNAPALEAVLADARANGAGRFFNLGDSVGEAPFPNETVALLIANDVVSIRGNFDRNITEYEERINKVHRRKHPARVAAIRFTHAAIAPEYLEYLRRLPPRREVTLGGVRFLLVHGSPRRESEFMYASSSEDKLAEIAAGVEADVIVAGHTHQPFVRETAAKLFINAGSAGRPVSGKRPSYVLTRIDDGRVDAGVRYVDYPVERVTEAIDRFGLPVALRNVFLKGRWLE